MYTKQGDKKRKWSWLLPNDDLYDFKMNFGELVKYCEYK